jgi:hypothetical protein
MPGEVIDYSSIVKINEDGSVDFDGPDDGGGTLMPAKSW